MIEAAAILDRLALAHALLAAGRTTFALARDASTLPVELEADDAVQFCLTGAVHRAIYEQERVHGMTTTIFGLLQAVFCGTVHYPFPLITHWNDCHATDEAALALLEECAACVNPK